MSGRPRITLYGKQATEDEIISEITKLLQGVSERRPYCLSGREIAKVIGAGHSSVYSYIKKAEQQKKIQRLENGRYVLPSRPRETVFRLFNHRNQITSNPLVADWMDDLLTRKQGIAM